jgi:hypothetical protein
MKKLILVVMVLTLVAMLTHPVLGNSGGTIRIEPHGSYYPFPVMLDSPADFSIFVQPGGDPTCDPHILLVITNDTYHELADLTVTVNWTDTDTISIDDWTGPETENSKEIPDGWPLHPGVGYTVASLQDHLNTSDPIYWNFTSFLGAQLTQTPQEFTVTVPLSVPFRMLVYALGKTGEYDDFDDFGEEIECPESDAPFDNRVPPTKPGLVIPELATILLTAASFCGFALYGYKRKR